MRTLHLRIPVQGIVKPALLILAAAAIFSLFAQGRPVSAQAPAADVTAPVLVMPVPPEPNLPQ